MVLPAPLQRRARVLLVSDLDWTMVDHDDHAHDALSRFNRLWASSLAPDSVLVFSTGRSPELFRELAAEAPLLRPDLLVCSVGTEILSGGEPLEAWAAHLDAGGWDREAARAVAARVEGLTPQADSEQRRHKLSYLVDRARGPEVVARLRQALQDAFGAPSDGTVTVARGPGEGTSAKSPASSESPSSAVSPTGATSPLPYHVIFSGGVDVDLLPSRASKGAALAFLLSQLEPSRGGPGAPTAGTLVCGDSGNDVELFRVPGVFGCAVANAHPELAEWCDRHASDHVFRATRRGPGGIFQALEALGFSRHAEPRPETVHRRTILIALLQELDDAASGLGGGGGVANADADADADTPAGGQDHTAEPAPALGDLLADDFVFSSHGGGDATTGTATTTVAATTTTSPTTTATTTTTTPTTTTTTLGKAAFLARVAAGRGSASPRVQRTWLDDYEETEVAPASGAAPAAAPAPAADGETLWRVTFHRSTQAFHPTGAGPDGPKGGGRAEATLRRVHADEYLVTSLSFR